MLANHFDGLSPSGLVEWQQNATSVEDRYKILRLAQTWIDKQTLRYSTKCVRLFFIRSFFLHNLAILLDDRRFHFKSDVPPVEGKLPFDDLRRIILNSNKKYRAVFCFMAATLLDESSMVYVSNNYAREVVEALTKNVGVVKLTLPGRKQTRNKKSFYTMFSTKSDAVDALRDYLKSLPEVRLDVLFRNDKGNPLNQHNIWRYFRNRAAESGVIKPFTPLCSKCYSETVKVFDGRKVRYKCKECNNEDSASEISDTFTNVRYGVNPHEIRDLMRSRWHVSGADGDVAEFMMGHNIDPNNYNKFMKIEPWYPLQEYRKALPWLNIVSQDPSKVDRTEIDSKLESSEAKVDALSSELALLKRKLKVLDDPVLLEALKALRKSS